MFRLYALAFHGECRADEETQKHIHESPGSMTMPLVVLAIATCFLGFLGLPHLEMVHLPNFFHDFLAPVVAPAGYAASGGANIAAEAHHLHDSQVLGLMGIATVLGAIGSFVAFSMYKNGFSKRAVGFAEGESTKPIYEASLNKLWVDEIYEKIILEPFRKTCKVLFEAADRIVIDTFFVGGAAAVVDIGGRVVRWFQNGQVQRYLVVVVIGAAAIFWMATSPRAAFEYEIKEGTTAVVVLESGINGAAANGAVIEWDWTGDGKADATGPKVENDFAGPGRYEVTMRITDGVFSRTAEKTRVVVVEEVDDQAAPQGKANEGGNQ
jgi:NADH-quinone oxidoreductase subunit L